MTMIFLGMFFLTTLAKETGDVAPQGQLDPVPESSIPQSSPEEIIGEHGEDLNAESSSSSSSSSGNPFLDLLTPEHDSYHSGDGAVEDLYCSEVINYFPGWNCVQEGYFGEGGNGVTFIVNNGTETEYMLKVQKDKSDRGFKALLDVQNHKNIIEVIKADYIGEHLVQIIEFADFGNLKSYINKNKNQFKDDTFVLEFFLQIVDGIAHCHSQKIVHADIKLANIVVDKNHVPKIIDFDLCVREHEKKGGRGTSQYMAPEVYKVWSSSKRYFNGKEDVTGLAVTLYYMFFRNFPFHASGRKKVLELMKRKTFPLKAGTRLDVAQIFKRGLMWRNLERAEMAELKQLTEAAMNNKGAYRRLMYDENISTSRDTMFIESILPAEAWRDEMIVLALSVIGTLLLILLIGRLKTGQEFNEDWSGARSKID
jgi:serine/threonine protein kinase